MNANEFFQDILSATTIPISRVINVAGIEKTIFVKRISAGDRLKLTPGNKIAINAGVSSGAEFSLQDLIQKQHLLVSLAITDEKGKTLFQNAEAVAKLPDALIKELYKCAEDVNREADEVGKPE